MAGTLGAYLRAKRDGLGINQTELSRRSGVPRETINRIENDKTALPMADARRRLASALGVSHLDLLVAAGEITRDELGTVAGIVERAPDDPLTAITERLARVQLRSDRAGTLTAILDQWIRNDREGRDG